MSTTKQQFKFNIGDILILKEMHRSSEKYDKENLSEKLILVVDIKKQPYGHYVIEFPFTKAPNNKNIVRTTMFIEDYYQLYKSN